MNHALRGALCLVLEKGLEARFVRHKAHGEQLASGLNDLGSVLHVPLSLRLPTLANVRVPHAVNEANLRRRLLERYNIEIGGNLGILKGKVLRIELMGYSSQ